MRMAPNNPPVVIPAKAGIHPVVVTAPIPFPRRTVWIPAFAGMTVDQVPGLGVAAYLQPFNSDALEHEHG